jgi:hypothetical protein
MSGAYLPTATRASLSTAYFRALGNNVFTNINADTIQVPTITAPTGEVIEL